ncbi:hypothetical protein GETHLI_09800 [Geothrix limicola]|uniref:Lipoprotein n=1 Tax=Geothrix limicola TaxID=2927978 RepID=A0ABQ5QDL5_9BACT|nr:hypothetical protein [Geothrix limicola]GLH72478.1 hypothetical protein GETHLI_09800 [Geothrix limicola]
MRSFSLANPLLAIILGLLTIGCGRKGDPIPRPRAAAQPVEARLEGLRSIRLVLPRLDTKDEALVGVEIVRVLYLPLGLVKPTPEEVFSHGEVVLERRRPDLPGPGGTLLLDLKSLQRPQGWIVIVAVRLGNVPGRPSEVLPWMAPAL